MKVNDIPKFINPPHYRVTVAWDYLEEWIADKADTQGLPGSLGIDLDPDFQRGHVWTQDKQKAYVEFCLRGGQSSRTLLWNHPNWMGDWKGMLVLVDGKQRLEAVRKFVRNELPIFAGVRLNDFDDPKRLLRGTYASFEFGVNNLKTRPELLEWYLQLNDGGVVHTPEEIQRVRDLLEAEKAKKGLG